MSFLDRFKVAIDSVPGENVESRARALGIANPTLYAYLKGKRVPNTDFLIQLKKVTGINLDWLLTGEEAEKKDSMKIDSEYYTHVCNWLGQLTHVLFKYFFLFTTYDQGMSYILENNSIEDLEKSPYYKDELETYKKHPFFDNVTNSTPFVFIPLDKYIELSLMIYNYVIDDYALNDIQTGINKISPFIKTMLHAYSYKKLPPSGVTLSDDALDSIQTVIRLQKTGADLDDLLPDLINKK